MFPGKIYLKIAKLAKILRTKKKKYSWNQTIRQNSWNLTKGQIPGIKQITNG